MLLPINLGNAYIVDDYNTAFYHVNLTLIENSITQLNQTFSKVTYEESIFESTFHHLGSLTSFKTSNVKSLIHEIFGELHKITYHKRSKRGLFNFVGSIQKYLFGTMDSNDQIKYDSYIQTLKENQEINNNNIKQQNELLRQVTDSFHTELTKISRNQILIKDTIDKFMSTDNHPFTKVLAVNIILDNIILQCEKLKSLIDHIQIAINFAQANIMHLAILKTNELELILNKIPNENKIPFDNMNNYYETMYTNVLIEKDLIIFTIKTPVIRPSPYLLYKVYPIPEQNLTISLNYPYNLLSASNYYNLKQSCKKVENIYLCSTRELKQEEPCLYELTRNIHLNCKSMPIQYRKLTIIKLPDGQTLIIPINATSISFHCKKTTFLEVIIEPTVINNKNCELVIGNTVISPKTNENIYLDLKLPNLNVSLIKSIDVKPLDLDTVDDDHIKKVLKNVENLKLQDLNIVKPNNTHNIYVYISTIVIMIIVVTLIITFHLYTKKNVKKPLPGIELQEKEPLSQMSPTFAQS